MLPLEYLTEAEALVLLFPLIILGIQVLAAFFSKEGDPIPDVKRPRLALLVPAHDEASGIGDTLRRLATQLQDSDRVLVVADNCTDETAAIASGAGAEVIVRQDPSHRGKGYALDFGIRHLEHDPPEVVLVVDADCRMTDTSVDRLARVCARTGRPVQALNLIHTPPEGSVMMRVAEFASAVKNRVRPLGLRRLGLPCQLTGTGMAFPWICISKAPLATGHIAEDLKLGLELTSSGSPPLLCPEARVASYFPTSNAGFISQRTRWEHGYLGVLIKDAPALLLRSLARRNVALLALVLDLCVPPIALLSLMTAAIWAASALLYARAGTALPLLLASSAAGILALSILASWVRYGREILSLRNLVLAAVYALWKIPLYGRFLIARQLHWVRAKREEGASDETAV